MITTIEEVRAAGLDPARFFFPNKTMMHTENFCCGGCGTVYWATKEYAILRAKAQVKPACGTACMRKVGGYIFS